MNKELIQVIGFIALGFGLLAFQKKQRGKILLFLIFGQCLFTLHFFLLRAWTGAAMNGIAAVRTFVFNNKENQKWAKSRFWPFIFILCFWVVGLFSWQGYYSLLPVLAMTAESFAVWLDEPKKIRQFMLIPRPLWFTYNVIVHSYAGIVAEILVFISIIISIIRFDILNKKSSRPV